GNTLICEGTTGRIFEVTGCGDLVWEFVNYFPYYEASPIHSRSCPVYSAYRYGMDYPGLERLKR
ncbi:MAG: thioredoxin, partial [Spirochaetota bacterium]